MEILRQAQDDSIFKIKAFSANSRSRDPSCHLEATGLSSVVMFEKMHPKEYDIEWRKSRLAARLLISNLRRPLSPRRRAIAGQLARDTAVSNRLINQALAGFYAERPHSISLD